MMSQSFQGQIVDLWNKSIFPGEITINDGHILDIKPMDINGGPYILPGFIDAHVHIESSMLVPSEFARMAVIHGTVGTVSDPHEIANVLGVPGIEFMLDNAAKSALKIHFGAPSCVPATTFETAGAIIGVEEVKSLLERKDIWYLSEMMNYPGVLQGDQEVMAKIAASMSKHKPIDGHAPGLRGQDAKAYIEAGMTTDHECYTYAEGREKAELGMHIIIREGSAAKNFEALIPLIREFPDQIMFCSDDKHPDDLMVGHINQHVKRAIMAGFDVFQVLRAACLNPVQHYKLPVGLLRVGDPADFILVEDLKEFKVLATYINGQQAAGNGMSYLESVAVENLNKFNCQPVTSEDLKIEAHGKHLKVIKVLDGQLITETLEKPIKIKEGFMDSDPDDDVLKIVVINRYHSAPPAIGFIHGFGLKSGAIASCVAHDSHNIVAVGVDDDSLAQVINEVIKNSGGIAACSGNERKSIALPIGGIMTGEDGPSVARNYAELDGWVKHELKSTLKAPFMSLSFMALLVIPQLKMSDLGLFDGGKFSLTQVSY